MNSASLLARMNFANALAQGKIAGRESRYRAVHGRSRGDRARHSPDGRLGRMRRARQFRPGLPNSNGATTAIRIVGPLVAGLTLGSPDFQRR